MQEAFDPQFPQGKRKTSRAAVVIGALVVTAILVSFWLLFQVPQNSKNIGSQRSGENTMTAGEQDYVTNIEIVDVGVSRSENFLHQEVTTVSGELRNTGNQTVSSLSIAAEFMDASNQIVLRELRKIGAPGSRLGPGERRNFEFSFERVPDSWNRQAPALHVASLHLAAPKPYI